VRIVSLVPSATETLFAWGVEPVAVTRWCLHPELPQVGGTKDPDVAAIAALRPDVVVLCEEENRREDAEALDRLGLATHVIRIRSVADVGPEMAALAARVGVSPPGPAALPAAAAPVTRAAFVPIWRQRAPGGLTYTTLNDDTYGASVLRAIGVRICFGDAAERYPTVSPAEAVASAPDLVVAPSEPYPFGPRHVEELSAIAPVVLVDGQDLFWWGARTAAALGRLHAALASVP
jgi:ABC-type Fe3+-hydroxamate transport system substrate-binding protein